MSFSGPDREAGRQLANELRTLGARVFVDESIECYSGITKSIRTALSESKTLVAYFSTDYAERAACQHELLMVFLAGEREGDPCGRIMVINPEPGTGHLRPIQLADAKFAVPDAGTASTAGLIAKRAAALTTPIGTVLPAAPPRWPASRAGIVRNFVGRYRELWDLHTALHAADYPLIDESACGSFVAVSGLPGAGKTALATTYAWRFAGAFPGGVRWVSLKGSSADPESLRLRYEATLPGTGGEQPARSDGRSDGASLLIVDDIPAGVGPELLETLPLPTDSAVRTILVCEDDIFRDCLPVVRVGPLPSRDAATLLDAYRLPDDDQDRAARDQLAERLGHNAAALVTVGDHLRDRHGLLSYRAFADDLDPTGTVGGAIFAPAHGVLDRMTSAERTFLSKANELQTTTFSAPELIDLGRLVPFDVGAALKMLRHRSAAVRIDTSWYLDPYVMYAARLDSLVVSGRG
ncbi:TIR domain-containing protein [Amycolatopsis balhimycina DSM 5908]|uniref:TIR domain-containing protein n=1 Tax=Amycolatopsis balhimycina DSM 5908 TaxID=1081091 RepID=A0A428WNR6_AMYBA|nr:TIR domain-containing protein [Amycolatopsis balhimycina DSM 5908]